MLIKQVSFALHVIFHPFDGFWDMKYERRGRVGTSLLCIFLLFVVVVIKRQYTGFIINFNNPADLNSISELTYIVLPFFLFCVSNWSLTTLMDGEGKFKEIVMATGYALIPMAGIYLITTLASRLLNAEESPFLSLLDSAAVVWFLGLLFVGTMTIHQYTIGKTILTIILTMVVMAVIMFLGLLFFSLVQQMIVFVFTIYQELTLRQ